MLKIQADSNSTLLPDIRNDMVSLNEETTDEGKGGIHRIAMDVHWPNINPENILRQNNRRNKNVFEIQANRNSEVYKFDARGDMKRIDFEDTVEDDSFVEANLYDDLKGHDNINDYADLYYIDGNNVPYVKEFIAENRDLHKTNELTSLRGMKDNSKAIAEATDDKKAKIHRKGYLNMNNIGLKKHLHGIDMEEMNVLKHRPTTKRRRLKHGKPPKPPKPTTTKTKKTTKKPKTTKTTKKDKTTSNESNEHKDKESG